VRRRVAITGLGAVTPIGVGVKSFWQGLRDGILGVGTITRFDPAPFACRVAAEVPPTMNHDIPAPECDLDYVPGRGRTARVSRVLVTSRAIGPTHSAVVLGRPDDD
jgi:3-oxoacyl-(acyl-carrier-protein) synthase